MREVGSRALFHMTREGRAPRDRTIHRAVLLVYTDSFDDKNPCLFKSCMSCRGRFIFTSPSSLLSETSRHPQSTVGHYWTKLFAFVKPSRIVIINARVDTSITVLCTSQPPTTNVCTNSSHRSVTPVSCRVHISEARARGMSLLLI